MWRTSLLVWVLEIGWLKVLGCLIVNTQLSYHQPSEQEQQEQPNHWMTVKWCHAAQDVLIILQSLLLEYQELAVVKKIFGFDPGFTIKLAWMTFSVPNPSWKTPCVQTAVGSAGKKLVLWTPQSILTLPSQWRPNKEAPFPLTTIKGNMAFWFP